MTDQELADFVETKIHEQGCASVRPATEDEQCDFGIKVCCLYRGPNGVKCAAGHLLPDCPQLSALEGSSAYKVARILRRQGVDPGWPERQDHLVSALQSAHDKQADTPDEPFLPGYHANMAALRKNRGLAPWPGAAQ